MGFETKIKKKYCYLAVMASTMMHLKNKHSGLVWPSSEIEQEKVNSSTEANPTLKK